MSGIILLICWARCWRQTAAGTDDSPGTTRSTKLSIVQVIDFRLSANRGVSPIFHSSEYPCFKHSISSNGTTGVSSSDRTVTNRSKSWKKLVRPRLSALSQSRSVPTWGLWIFSKCPFLSELKSHSCSALYFFSRQVPRCFAVTMCLPWGILRCCSSKTGRARISLMRFTFLG